MAREATLIYETALPMAYIVADGTGIEKGTFLKQADPMTASATSATNDVVAGIAAQEKIASDGKTKLAVYTDGKFKGTASGTITMGSALQIAAPGNYLKSVTDLSGANIVGYAEEAATADQTFIFRLQIQNHVGANSSVN